MCMHINNMQLITAEIKKHSLFCFFVWDALVAKTKGQHKQELPDCFEILAQQETEYEISIIFAGSRRGCPVPQQLPNQHGHPSQYGSMDHVPRKSPVGSGERLGSEVAGCSASPKAWNTQDSLQSWQPDLQSRGLWREKQEKRSQIALLEKVIHMICLGADHRITDYFGLKGALKTT